METQTESQAEVLVQPFRKWGFWAVMSGALALVLVFAQFVGPSYEPQPSVGTQIGEIAGEIKRSAWRSFFGLKAPEPQVRAASVWDHLAIIAPILGIVAVVLSLISGVLRENWRFALYGTGLGATAIVFQFLWLLALLICGVLLLIVIIENMGDIFSF